MNLESDVVDLQRDVKALTTTCNNLLNQVQATQSRNLEIQKLMNEFVELSKESLSNYKTLADQVLELGKRFSAFLTRDDTDGVPLEADL